MKGGEPRSSGGTRGRMSRLASICRARPDSCLAGCTAGQWSPTLPGRAAREVVASCRPPVWSETWSASYPTTLPITL